MWFCLSAQPCEQSHDPVSTGLTRMMLVGTKGALGDGKQCGLKSGQYPVLEDGERGSL